MKHLLLDYDAFVNDVEKYSHRDLKAALGGVSELMSTKELNKLVSFLNETDVSKLQKYSYKQIAKWILAIYENDNFANMSYLQSESPLLKIYGQLKNISVIKDKKGRRLL